MRLAVVSFVLLIVQVSLVFSKRAREEDPVVAEYLQLDSMRRAVDRAELQARLQVLEQGRKSLIDSVKAGYIR